MSWLIMMDRKTPVVVKLNSLAVIAAKMEMGQDDVIIVQNVNRIERHPDMHTDKFRKINA